MRLLVTGCPRSGNTLLYLLVAWGFDGWTRLLGEQLPFPSKGGHVVGKRLAVAPALPEILEYDSSLRVVWMIRDPRDACVSLLPRAPHRPPMVTDWVWIERAKTFTWLRSHPRVLLIRYEDLVRDPKAEQKRLASWLGVPEGRCWSEWDGANIAEKTDKKNFWTLCGVRPIETSRIGSHLGSSDKRKATKALMKNDRLLRHAEVVGDVVECPPLAWAISPSK